MLVNNDARCIAMRIFLGFAIIFVTAIILKIYFHCFSRVILAMFEADHTGGDEERS